MSHTLGGFVIFLGVTYFRRFVGGFVMILGVIYFRRFLGGFVMIWVSYTLGGLLMQF